MRSMSGKANDQPQGATPPSDGTPSKNAAKAARREAMRAQMLRDQAKARRTARLKLAGVVAIVVVIVAAVGTGVALSINGSGGGGGGGSASTSLDPQVEKAITNVSPDVIDAVGAGSGVSISKPVALTGATPLTSDGKPRVLYVGAEYCPYCAAQRWAVVNALSRFGTFKGLGQTTSSSTDVDPDTSTLSFHGATYTSDYLSFTGVEQTDRDQQPLDTLSPEDQKILDTYDTKQYVGSDGGIPFIDYGGKFASSGAAYDPATLHGLSHQDIAKDLSDPNSKVTKSIVGAANAITSTLCQLTDQKPANVCSAAGVKAAS